MLEKRRLTAFLTLCMLVCIALPFTNKRNSNASTAPILTIESYELTKGDFSPGNESTITLNVKNYSDKYSADNIIITMSCPDMTITPVYGTSNQRIFDTIGAGQSAQFEFVVDVPTDIEVEKANISFNISYTASFSTNQGVKEDYQSFSNDSDISIPITYDQSFEVTSVSVAESTNVGATTLVSISYSNNDTADVTDINLTMEGNIDDSTSSVSIGELSAGQTGVQDTYVKFTKAGAQTLNLLISYVDSDGRTIKKDLGKYTVQVDETVSTSNQSNVTVEEDSSASVLKVALAAVAVLLIAACIIMYRYKKKEYN